MTSAFKTRALPRLDSANQRLAVALVASLLAHALIFATWKASPAIQKLSRAFIQRVMPRLAQAMEARAPNSPPPARPPRETPLLFVEVDPALAAAEPPKNTKFYSTHDSLAANPTPRAAAEVPKIDGTQTKMVRMADNPKPDPKPLQPTPPKPDPTEPKEPEKQPDPKPRPEQKVGDLAMSKPQPKTTDAGTADTGKPRSKPRTIKEAMQRNPALAGQKTLQDGGVPRRSHLSMVDAKGSPFGDYDRSFIAAVEQRWFQLLDNNQYMLDRQGKVVLDFRLHYDGRISNLQTDANTVGEILGLLCQKAILDPAPFPKWPAAMRQAMREEYRDVKFTFHYDCNCP